MGRWFSGRYGYGLMDAAALVQRGRSWTNVPQQRTYGRPIIRIMRAQEGVHMTRKLTKEYARATTYFEITADNLRANEGGFINLIEHATIKITTKSNKSVFKIKTLIIKYFYLLLK